MDQIIVELQTQLNNIFLVPGVPTVQELTNLLQKIEEFQKELPRGFMGGSKKKVYTEQIEALKDTATKYKNMGTEIRKAWKIKVQSLTTLTKAIKQLPNRPPY